MPMTRTLSFYQLLDRFIKKSDRNNRRFSLLYIDLDNFKDVNDSLGHDAVELLLKETASRLSVPTRFRCH